MATRKKAVAKKAPVKKSSSKAVVSWQDELAQQAEIAASMEEGVAAGQFFSTKGGILTFNDNPLPNNEMAVIITDHIFETVYYEGAYDPDSPGGPTAFALGRVQDELVWHENSREDFAGQLCSESEVCEWGSADTGRGKAARETRRLGLIPAGNFARDGSFDMIEDEAHYETTPVAFMRLPVTSVRGFSSYVKSIAGALKRPPHGVVTRIYLTPDPKTQFRVGFESICEVPDEFMPAVMKRHEETQSLIDFPYQVEEQDEAPARSRSKKKVAKKTSRRKY